MKAYWLSCLIILTSSIPALADGPPGQVLYEGTECRRAPGGGHPELELFLTTEHLLLTIDEGRQLLVERKAGLQAIAALKAIETAEDEGESLLELLGWPVVITAVVVVGAAAFAFGIFLGFDLAQPAPVLP